MHECARSVNNGLRGPKLLDPEGLGDDRDICGNGRRDMESRGREASP
jgi:hypothetical protein